MHPLAEKQIVSATSNTPIVSPEIGDGYFVRSFSGADLEAWESELSARRKSSDDSLDMAGLRARLVQLGICDENGVSVFADCAIEQINAMPAARLQALYDAVKTAWGLVPKDDDAKN